MRSVVLVEDICESSDGFNPFRCKTPAPFGDWAFGEQPGLCNERPAMKKIKSAAKAPRASGKIRDLRAKADRSVAKKPRDLRKFDPEDMQELLNEFPGRQVEMEMQNEELRKAQGEIEEWRSRFLDLFDFAPIPYFTFDGNGAILEVNFKGAELLGLERQALVRKPFSNFVVPGDRNTFRRHRQDTLRQTSRQRCELKIARKDGTILDVTMESISGKDSNGHVTQVRSALWNVTELREKDEKIRGEQAFREAIENSIRLGVVAFDDEGRHIYANPAFCQMVGWSLGELIGAKPPFPYWPEEGRRAITEAFLEVLSRQKGAREYELRFQHRRGRRFDALVIFSELSDQWGQSIGWMASVGDITERKRQEEEIRKLNAELEGEVRLRTAELEAANKELGEARAMAESERLYLKTILETVPAAVVVAEGPPARMRFLNKQGIQFYLGRESEYEPPIVLPVEKVPIRNPDGTPRPFEEFPVFRAFLKGEEIRGAEIIAAQQEGGDAFLLVNATPLRDKVGNIVGGVGIALEITALKKIELEIKSLNEELQQKTLHLEAANRELEAYTSTVSHDLKNPLVVMGNIIGRLIKKYGEELDPKGKEYLRILQSTSGRMTELVDALLELSHVSKAPLKSDKVDLSGLAESILSNYRENNPARRVEAIVARGMICRGDRSLLQSVLDNLFSNAWKFTRNCSPARIEFGILREGPDPAYFIRDNGCGFDVPRDMAQVFLPFQRYHDPEEYPGTGIGLATVNRAILRHGGKVWLKSEVGKGTTVYFTLPGG